MGTKFASVLATPDAKFGSDLGQHTPRATEDADGVVLGERRSPVLGARVSGTLIFVAIT